MLKQQDVPVLSAIISFKCGIKNSEGKYLLLKRSTSNRTNIAKWELPGGKIEQGEDPYKGLKREVHEETGLNIIWVYPTVHLHTEKIEVGPYAENLLIKLIGETDQYEGTLNLSEEHTEYTWVTVEEALQADLKEDTKRAFEYLAYGR